MSANLNDPAVQAYCSHVLRPHLEILRKKAQSIQRRRNIEDIHDLRVSSRRIRTCLNVFAEALPPKKIKVWQRDIRSITNAFSRVRDLDVQLDWIMQMATIRRMWIFARASAGYACASSKNARSARRTCSVPRAPSLKAQAWWK